MRASVIDLGYNSLKMVSYEIRPDGSFRAFDQRGGLTRIGQGLHETGFLGQEPMERTLRVLRMLKEVNRLSGIGRVLCIATSPIRDAANGREFLQRVTKETGLEFRVLAGKEEALYSYLGAARSTRLRDVLFFDLGGGSLELVYARDYRVRKITSLPIGALRLTELYGTPDERFGKKGYEDLKQWVEELLPDRDELGLTKATVLMGVGGTVRALAKYDQWLRDYPLNKLHNYVLSSKSISAMNKMFRKLDAQKISKIEVMGKDRAISVTAGSLVVATMMRRLRFGGLTVSTHGLRDGVLAEYLRDSRVYGTRPLDETRANESLASWSARRSGSEELTRDLEERGVITDEERLILDEAVGEFLDIYLSTRAENIFYAILNEDSFLDHRNQVEMALAFVRAKAPKTSNWFYSRYRRLLKGKSRESLDKLSAFIQLAEVLELTRSSATVHLKGEKLTLTIRSSKKDLPVLLLEQSAKDLRNATSLKVKILAEHTPVEAEVLQTMEREHDERA